MKECRFIIIAFFFIFFNSVAALAVASLSFTDVETLLRSKVSNGRIVNLVKERKVSFDLSKETIKKLKKLGANQSVINVIGKSIQTGIQIESEPSGAEVFVDRIFMGNTPLRLTNIATGKHELRVDKVEGYKAYVTEMELLPGQTWKNTVVLKKHNNPELSPRDTSPLHKMPEVQQLVAVRVRTEPVNANIYLDDKYIGESPAEFLASVGNHHLRLVPKMSTKYETVEKEISVRSKELNAVFLRLNSKMD